MEDCTYCTSEESREGPLCDECYPPGSWERLEVEARVRRARRYEDECVEGDRLHTERKEEGR